MIQNNFFGSIIRRLYKMQPFYIYYNKKKFCQTYEISKVRSSLNDVIAYEDLRVKNLVKNHCLAKSINDAAWYQFLWKLLFNSKRNHSVLEGPLKDKKNPMQLILRFFPKPCQEYYLLS